MTILSLRSKKIKSFLAMQMMERAAFLQRGGEKIISLSLGEPDLSPPESAKRACLESISANETKYVDSGGLSELREGIAEYYQVRYRVKVHPDQIVITSGSSPAFYLILATLLNPQDEVILPSLYYPCYPNFIHLADGVVRLAPVSQNNFFHYSPEDLPSLIHNHTKAIFLTSPSNPTGYLFPEEKFHPLVQFSPHIVSDEIYHGLVYGGGGEHTILEFTDRAFVINGFSKAYSMTGFRLGYLIAPKKFIPTILRIQQSMAISVSAFIQKAGLAALKEGEEDKKRILATFQQRREVALEELKKIGFHFHFPPNGAFYLFLDVRNYTSDSYQFALDFLERKKVAITPGIDFGEAGEGFVRIAYTASIDDIREGIGRLGEYLFELRRS